jgi:threonine dehydrogenase-like Zn-dependent dehydrogenase
MAASKLVRRKPQAYGADYKVEPIAFYHNDWPRLVLQANYIEKISIDLFSFMPGEGATVITPMDRGVEDRQKVIEAIRTGRIKAADYVEKVAVFTDAPQAYQDLLDRKILSVAYKWN